MLDLLTDIALIFSFLLAPGFYIWTVWNQRRYRNVIYTWKYPGAAVITLIAFALNLALFILTAIFFSGILGSRTYPEIFNFTADTMRHLALVSGAFMVGLTLLYLGVHRMMSQIICYEGIWLLRVEGLSPFPKRKLLKWDHIRDYYTREDYPVTEYFFICRKDFHGQKRVKIKVPLPAHAGFEQILDHFLNHSIPDDGESLVIPDFSGK